MLYVHYCITCDKIHILNGHKKFVLPAEKTARTETHLFAVQYT